MNRRDFLAVTGGAVGGTVLGAGGAVALGPGRALPAMGGSGGRTSFAAMGEDLILASLLRETLGIETPTYVDIGAADPVAVNNTYLLYTQGSRGVLVEPNPTYVERLRAVRPRDAVVGAGIGTGEATEADYYVMADSPMLNTFSAEMAAYREREEGAVVEAVMQMPLLPLTEVIDEYLGATPDLIAIDAEGMDLAIIRSLDLGRHRPPVICAETKGAAHTHESTALATYLAAEGYLVTAGTIHNTILVDRARVG